MRRYRFVDGVVLPLLGTAPEPAIELAADDVNGVWVRTKFLGYSLSGLEPPPDVFETMVYAEPPPYPRWHTATPEEALRAHSDAIAWVRRGGLRLV
jgi:hypothetical protein